MDSILEKLKWRLQSVANNYSNGGCDSPALIFINLFLRDGMPIAWYKPQRILLEPKLVDYNLLPLKEKCNGWEAMIDTLVPTRYEGVTLDRILVIDGNAEPVGWLS